MLALVACEFALRHHTWSSCGWPTPPRAFGSLRTRSPAFASAAVVYLNRHSPFLFISLRCRARTSQDLCVATGHVCVFRCCATPLSPSNRPSHRTRTDDLYQRMPHLTETVNRVAVTERVPVRVKVARSVSSLVHCGWALGSAFRAVARVPPAPSFARVVALLRHRSTTTFTTRRARQRSHVYHLTCQVLGSGGSETRQPRCHSRSLGGALRSPVEACECTRFTSLAQQVHTAARATSTNRQLRAAGRWSQPARRQFIRVSGDAHGDPMHLLQSVHAFLLLCRL